MKQSNFKKKVSLLLTGALSMMIVQPVWAQSYEGHWAAKSLTTWKNVDFMLKDIKEEGKLNEYVTRGELVQFIADAFNLTDATYLEFYMGIFMDGKDKVANPNEVVTREEAAYILARTYKIQGSSKLQSAYTPELEALIEWGIILGDNEQGINPKGVLTKAQLVTMFDRLTAKVYGKAGQYAENIDGNLIISTSDIILKDMTVQGNLYITQGVGEGEVTLDNVTVTGKVYVEGGGLNSIHMLNGTKLNYVQVNKADGKVCLVTDKDSAIVQLDLLSGAKLSANVKTVKVLGPTLTKEKPVIEIDKSANLEKVICDIVAKFIGTGTINQIVINVNGVEIKVNVKEVVFGDKGIQVDKDNHEDDNNNNDKDEDGNSEDDKDEEDNNCTTSSALEVNVKSINFSEVLDGQNDLNLTFTLKDTAFNTEDFNKIKDAIELNMGNDFTLATTGSTLVINKILGVTENDYKDYLEVKLNSDVLTTETDLKARIEIINDVQTKPDIPIHPNANKYGNFTEPYYTEAFMKGGQQFYLIQMNGIEITQKCANEFNKTLKAASSLDGSPMYLASSRDKLYFKFFPYGNISNQDVWTITLPDWATTAGEEVIFQVPIIH